MGDTLAAGRPEEMALLMVPSRSLRLHCLEQHGERSNLANRALDAGGPRPAQGAGRMRRPIGEPRFARCAGREIEAGQFRQAGPLLSATVPSQSYCKYRSVANDNKRGATLRCCLRDGHSVWRSWLLQRLTAIALQSNTLNPP